MVRSSVVLAVFGAACLGACDARPLRYGGATSPSELDGSASGDARGADAGTGDAADAGVIVPARRLLTVGDYFSCGLRADGAAACWGFNGDGQATPPPDKLTSISAGSRFACGLRPDGTIVCWGANAQKQSTPAVGSGFTQISAGDTHACAIGNNGQLACWGSVSGFTASGGARLQVVSGTDVSCGIDPRHLVVCWGRFSGAGGPHVPPSRFESISARHRLVCGLDADGHVLCFDVDGNPVGDSPTDHFTQIGAGGDFACGLRDDGRIVCWSTVPGQPLALSNQAPDGRFTSISIGVTGSCAVDGAGAIVCWGDDPIAGRAPLIGRFTDVSVSGGGGIESVEGTHGCALRIDGTPTCWGYEANVEASAPSGIFKQVSVGLISSCGIRASDSAIACWGDRGSGEGEAPDGPADRVAVGFGFACATQPPSMERCWGFDWGLAATTPSDPFTWISAGYDDVCYIVRGEIHCDGRKGATPGTGSPPAGSFQQVDTYMGHSCAIGSSGGALVCWGGNTWGESTPPPGGGYRSVTVGDSAGGGGAHSCAITLEAQVTCWGDHSYGKCAPPAQFFATVDAAENYTCGVSASGKVWCWGLQARQPLD